jgi:hypothetical protein
MVWLFFSVGIEIGDSSVGDYGFGEDYEIILKTAVVIVAHFNP